MPPGSTTGSRSRAPRRKDDADVGFTQGSRRPESCKRLIFRCYQERAQAGRLLPLAAEGLVVHGDNQKLAPVPRCLRHTLDLEA